jgi:hypothetical protein
MKLIRPVTVTNSVLTYSNVPETDYTAWSGATAYTVGTRCILVGTHKIYECLVANTNFSPDVNLTGTTPKWLEISSTNKWKMFDASWGSQTSIATPLTFVLAPVAIINSLALLNVDATSITVNVTVSAANVYSKTINMVGGEQVIDWYSYFFELITYKSDLVLTDIPPYSNSTITVSIINTSSTATCGNCVVGNYYDLGATQYGASAGIVDYSVKTTDSFGNTTVVQRTYAKRMSSNLMINNNIVDDVVNLLASYRSTPLVWVGAESNYTSLIVYGFYKDFDVNIAYPDYSSCSLTIEGLT